MRGYIIHLAWILSGFCFSLSISSEIAQAETAAAAAITEAKDNHLISAIDGSSIASSSDNQRSSGSKIMPSAATDRVEQIAQSLAQITAVQINRTEVGIEVVLQTVQGELSVPNTTTVGNALIADIPNAVLSKGEFSQANPIAGIALVNVTGLPGDRVRVAITGTDAPPVAEVRSAFLSLGAAEAQGLVIAVTLGNVVTGVDEDEIQVVVIGQQDDYFVPNASAATRTDTPILEIPQSIQVIPQQVLDDQQVTRLDEALQNSSGVIYGGSDTVSDVNYSIRGFTGAPVLIDGFRQYGEYPEIPEVANIERIEVLRGPASILYGEIQPGGVINLVTERPSSAPVYEAEFQAGSYGLLRSQIDISGSLTADESLLYRLNALYSRSDGFRDFDQEMEQFFVSPVLTWELSDRTQLTFDFQLSNREKPYDFGTIAFGEGVVDTPRDRIFNEPDDFLQRDFLSVGYTLEHEFSDNWSIRNAFRFTDSSTFSDRLSIPTAFDEATGLLTRVFALDDFDAQNYSLQTNVVGEFATGSVKHTLLFGIDLNRTSVSQFALASFTPFTIDVFNPSYGVDRPDFNTLLFDRIVRTDRLGIYLQDQVELFENLNLLLGLRYDTIEEKADNIPALFYPGGDTTENDDAFIPRVGIVYQPLADLSLYASYSQSFNPNGGVSRDGDPFDPERGQGFEVGIKTELLNGGLLATLAYFDITKQNVLTADPAFPGLGVSIATGEQRSRGIEFDLTGEISSGWNVIASYAYTDAEVTEDNTTPVGNQLAGIPQHNASLWTTYEIQRGNLQGLGFGVGVNYIGERQGDLANSFELGSYFLTNAAVFYERDNWRAALNFKNLFDVEYIGSNTGFGSRTNAGYVGEPFTLVGSITVSF